MDINVYILCGQSNAVGMAKVSSLPEAHSYHNVMIFNGGDCLPSERNRLLSVHPGQGWGYGEVPYFGPELGMADIFSAIEQPTVIIKYAYGGTAIFRNPDLNNKPNNHDNWHGPWDGIKSAYNLSDVNETTSGRLYTELMLTIQNALIVLKENGLMPRIRALAWMQGETDGEIQFNNEKYHAAADYQHNLIELFRSFREDISKISGQHLDEMPIVFGEINEFSTCIINAAEIIAAQKNVGLLKNNYYISTNDLPIDPKIDGWHWVGKEEFELGRRFAKAMLAHQNLL